MSPFSAHDASCGCIRIDHRHRPLGDQNLAAALRARLCNSRMRLVMADGQRRTAATSQVCMAVMSGSRAFCGHVEA